VASILDEIEGIVSGIEPTLTPKSEEPPAKPELQTPVAEATPEPATAAESTPESLEFSIGRLEAELEDAIATELGGELRPDMETPPAEVVAPQGPTPKSVPTEKPAEGADVIEGPPEKFEELPSLHRSNAHDLLAMVLSPVVTPIERLSPRDRILVNVAVLSVVLWVPIVWFLAS
jgi:hypothetical protein